MMSATDNVGSGFPILLFRLGRALGTYKPELIFKYNQFLRYLNFSCFTPFLGGLFCNMEAR